MGTPEVGGILTVFQFFDLRLDARHDRDHAYQGTGIVTSKASFLVEFGGVGVGFRWREFKVSELHGDGMAAALIGGEHPAADRLFDGTDARLLTELGGIGEASEGLLGGWGNRRGRSLGSGGGGGRGGRLTGVDS